ncbi:hypothetical protein B7W89_19660 [Agrobacterium tumefaciens]|uniref:hypothetical protein n=1 Tax=Agrobacterium tumefaciens TaxID=358 RepID=UPI000B3F6E58|nr:hypothetical protein [Agrobacterium tumefaciens]NSY03420.1 hypothetical protein [Agrobacterium tumefaciens]OVE88127.1 hypothetical protein B7W89_19660 [Agrobacterium tumefaciens]
MPETSKSPEQIRVESLIKTIQEHPTDVLEAERPLTAIKWFDYRFMSPKEANRLFMKTYQNIYRRKFAEEVDVERAKKVSGVHVLTMKDDARERSQLVAARQRADELGISYPVYIEAAFDFALKRSDKRKTFPRPNQLHGNDKSTPWLTAFIVARWKEQLPSTLASVDHPSYLLENYREIPAQDDFRRFVLNYVKEVNMPLHSAIRTFTYERQQVPAELFKSITTERTFKRAMEIVESDLNHIPVDATVPVHPISTHRWPTCFGMHYTLDPSSSECAACPQMEGCKMLGELILEKASAQAGVADPAGDYKRRNDRERQQRCRANKRNKNDKPGFSTLPHTPEQIFPNRECL